MKCCNETYEAAVICRSVRDSIVMTICHPSKIWRDINESSKVVRAYKAKKRMYIVTRRQPAK